MTTITVSIFELDLKVTKCLNSNLVMVKYFSVTNRQFILFKLGKVEIDIYRLFNLTVCSSLLIHFDNYKVSLLGHVWRF